jgi:16S rRNA (guanine527-N7)-methyltransferase
MKPPPGFTSGVESLGIALDAGDLERLARYLELLLEANQRFNLTAIADPTQAWTRHILDSLTLVPLIASAGAKTVIDIGSGGGLPGIPLAIVMPDVRFTLLEATGKKARFLAETIAALRLTNAVVINDRAETAAHDREHHRERYDMVLARAVGRLPVLLELTVPFAKVGGLTLAMKGAQAERETAEAKQALHMLHAHVIDRRVTPTGVIVVIEKQRTTPRLYPRAPGDPKRAPLGVKKPRMDTDEHR